MPHTRKVDDRHSVTIRSERRRDRGGWESTGDIYVTATNEDVGPTVHGEGRTMTSAEERAFQEARDWCFDRSLDPDEEE